MARPGTCWQVTNDSGAARHPRAAGRPAAARGAVAAAAPLAARDPGGGEFGFRRGGGDRVRLWPPRLAGDHSAGHHGGPGASRSARPTRPPALSAWTEPALSSHNRQLAIFITAVGALIAAAALITGGLAVLIGHAAPRWVALTLAAAAAELAVGHRHVRRQSRHPHRRALWPVGVSHGPGAGGGRAAGRRHHSRARYLAAATKSMFHRALYGLMRAGRAGLSGRAGRHAADRHRHRAGQRWRWPPICSIAAGAASRRRR